MFRLQGLSDDKEISRWVPIGCFYDHLVDAGHKSSTVPWLVEQGATPTRTEWDY
ncbi:MAG: hypothetical protein VW739_05510 [Pelagibacteraceae bacterium]